MKEKASNSLMFCPGPYDTVGTADLDRDSTIDSVGTADLGRGSAIDGVGTGDLGRGIAMTIVGTADLGRGIAIDIVRMQATVTTQIFLCLINGDHGTKSPIPTIVLRHFGDGVRAVSVEEIRHQQRVPLWRRQT